MSASEKLPDALQSLGRRSKPTPSPPTKSLGFRGFDSIRLLILKGEFSCPCNFIGSLPESLTQGLLVGKLLVGGLGVSLIRYMFWID